MASKKQHLMDRAVNEIADGGTVNVIQRTLENNDVCNMYGVIQCKNASDPPESETFFINEEFKKGSGDCIHAGTLSDVVDSIFDNTSVSITRTISGNDAIIQITNNTGTTIEVQNHVNITFH